MADINDMDFKNFDVMKIISKLARGEEVDFTKSSQILDSEIVIPTAIGQSTL